MNTLLSLWAMLGAVALSGLTGAAVAWPLWPRALRGRGHRLLFAAAALGLGLGLSALVYDLGLRLRGVVELHPLLLDLAALAAAGAFFHRSRSRERRQAAATATAPAAALEIPEAPPESRALRWVLAGVLLLTAALGGLAVWHSTRAIEHGAWDAWQMWNLRARFFYLGGPDWNEAFTHKPQAHRDYPPLLPATVARLWSYCGEASTLAPRLVGPLFGGLTALLLLLGLRALRGLNQGLLAAIVLLGFPFFVLHHAAQYAEPPLACFMLLAGVLLGVSELARERYGEERLGMYVLMGAAASFAAFTKNEGLVFTAAFAAAVLAVRWARGGWRAALARIGVFVLALLPVLLLLAAIKLGTSSRLAEMAQTHPLPLPQRLVAIERYKEIFFAIWIKVFSHPEHMILFMVPLYALLAGLHRRPARLNPVQGLLLLAGAAYLLALVPRIIEPPADLAQRTVLYLRFTQFFYLLALGHACYWSVELYRWLRQRPPLGRLAAMLGTTLVMLYGLYFMVFVVTSADVWKAALIRLFDNAWPLLVLAVFLALGRPEQMLAALRGPTPSAGSHPASTEAAPEPVPAPGEEAGTPP